MTVFIELVVDAYEEDNKELDSRYRKGAGVDSVRRPLRGLEIKDDTHAVIRVIGPDSKEVPLISSSYPDGSGPDYTNFILQSVSEAREEKVQIIETFGDAYIFFFGERPRFINVSATLINSFDFNWKAEFWANYEKYLRGTKCAEYGAKVYLFYDDNIIEGYMMKAQADESAMDPQNISLSFVLFVGRTRNVSFIESGDYPVRPTARVRDEAYEVAGLTDDGVAASTLPGWLETRTPNKAATRYHQTYGMLTPNETPRFNLPVRSKISDNWDEWTGDRLAYALDQKWLDYKEKQHKKQLENEAIKKACQAGAFANNTAFGKGFGLMGPGDTLSMSNIKDAWDSAESGDIEGVVSNLVTSNVTANINTPWGSGVATAGTNPEDGAYSGKEWLSKSELEQAYAGAGAGYHQGGAVGYNPFTGEVPGPAGRPGYYAGAGYFGSGQRGVPGHGSGSMPAGTIRKHSAGAWAGWSPGEGWSSGSHSYPGNQPPPGSSSQIPRSAATGTAGFGASASAGAYFGAAVGEGAYLGAAAGGGYASGNRPGGRDNPGTADSMYYSSAGASWDPDNGFQWDTSSDPNNPVPGQAGGGMFTTQAFGGNVNSSTWGPGDTDTDAASTPYGQVDPKQCPNQRGTSLGY